MPFHPLRANRARSTSSVSSLRTPHVLSDKANFSTPAPAGPAQDPITQTHIYICVRVCVCAVRSYIGLFYQRTNARTHGHFRKLCKGAAAAAEATRKSTSRVGPCRNFHHTHTHSQTNIAQHHHRNFALISSIEITLGASARQSLCHTSFVVHGVLRAVTFAPKKAEQTSGGVDGGWLADNAPRSCLSVCHFQRSPRGGYRNQLCG